MIKSKSIKFILFVAACLQQANQLDATKPQNKAKQNAVLQKAALAHKKVEHDLQRLDQRRLQSYNTVANKLACMSDQQITQLLSRNTQWEKGYGQTATIDIQGVPVFIKKIPLLEKYKNYIF